MLSAKFGINVRKIRRVRIEKPNEVKDQVRKMLTDTDQKLILMVRG